MTRPRFATFADMLGAMMSSAQGGPRDDRLAAATGANERSGTAGGFLVQPEHAAELLADIQEEAILAPLCDRRTTSRRQAGLVGLKLPAIDETSRADGSRWGGVRGYWVEEANAIPATKPSFREVELSPKKLAVLAYTTEELASDAPALAAHLRAAFRAELAFLLDDAIMSGLGLGRPLGYLAAEALIVVPKEPGQAAGTITAANLARMWQRLPVASRRRAVWPVNEDVETQIATDLGAAGYYRPAGADGSPHPTLFGRPMLAMEQAPALGALGDVSIADLSQYLLLDLGTREDVSIHVRFVEDEVIFRLVLRTDGAPGWKSPVAARNGSGTRSPFVALEARA